MPKRSKVLILENDDFLREILGNLLHKEGYYIINGYDINDGINNASSDEVLLIILGDSCSDYQGKSSINYLSTKFPEAQFILIHSEDAKVSFLPQKNQISLSQLSIASVLHRARKLLTD